MVKTIASVGTVLGVFLSVYAVDSIYARTEKVVSVDQKVASLEKFTKLSFEEVRLERYEDQLRELELIEDDQLTPGQRERKLWLEQQIEKIKRRIEAVQNE